MVTGGGTVTAAQDPRADELARTTARTALPQTASSLPTVALFGALAMLSGSPSRSGSVPAWQHAADGLAKECGDFRTPHFLLVCVGDHRSRSSQWRYCRCPLASTFKGRSHRFFLRTRSSWSCT